MFRVPSLRRAKRCRLRLGASEIKIWVPYKGLTCISTSSWDFPVKGQSGPPPPVGAAARRAPHACIPPHPNPNVANPTAINTFSPR